MGIDICVGIVDFRVCLKEVGDIEESFFYLNINIL